MDMASQIATIQSTVSLAWQVASSEERESYMCGGYTEIGEVPWCQAMQTFVYSVSQKKSSPPKTFCNIFT